MPAQTHQPARTRAVALRAIAEADKEAIQKPNMRDMFDKVKD